MLESWNDTATREAIEVYVENATGDRIAVFDNDGTLWCEKPMPIQLDFTLRHWAAMADADAGLRSRQPCKAAYERDYAWLGTAMSKHYEGDDGDLKLLIDAVGEAFGGMSVEDYAAEVGDFLADASHPTLGRPYRDCGYQPMVELLRYLKAHGFSTYIASGGDRDFMRPIASALYGIPAERVIGSSFALSYREDEYGSAVVCADAALRRRPAVARAARRHRARVQLHAGCGAGPRRGLDHDQRQKRLDDGLRRRAMSAAVGAVQRDQSADA